MRRRITESLPDFWQGRCASLTVRPRCCRCCPVCPPGPFWSLISGFPTADPMLYRLNSNWVRLLVCTRRRLVCEPRARRWRARATHAHHTCPCLKHWGTETLHCVFRETLKAFFRPVIRALYRLTAPVVVLTFRQLHFSDDSFPLRSIESRPGVKLPSTKTEKLWPLLQETHVSVCLI